MWWCRRLGEFAFKKLARKWRSKWSLLDTYDPIFKRERAPQVKKWRTALALFQTNTSLHEWRSYPWSCAKVHCEESSSSKDLEKSFLLLVAQLTESEIALTARMALLLSTTQIHLFTLNANSWNLSNNITSAGVLCKLKHLIFFLLEIILIDSI